MIDKFDGDGVLGMSGVLTAVVEGGVGFGLENPFYLKSALPFGVPPFDRIGDADYEPALMAGMDEQAAEIEAIAEDSAVPTFENTIVALEKSGALLTRVSAALGGVAGAFTNPVLEQLQEDVAPKMSAHSDAIYLNEKLFKRIEAVYAGRGGAGLDGESLRLLEVTYDDFVHAGARLNDEEKEKIKGLNEESSKLTNLFGRRLLGATKAGAYCTTDEGALVGLTVERLAAARAAAEVRGVEGFVLPLQNTTQQPVLAELSVRATREAVFQNAWTRAERGGENDTTEIVAKLAQVRAEKAKLMGYPSYAGWKLEDQMAKRPETAQSFLDAKVAAAVSAAAGEEKDIQELIDAQGGGFTVEAWDWEFYQEQVRKAKYDIDPEAVRPYFELNCVLKDGVFFAATELFGITFVERHDLPVYAPDVTTYEVLNADGSHLAILYCDWWKRDNKRGGAWMGSFLSQSALLKQEPLIYNVCNFTKPAEGQPALISFDDVTTMFHEFGHALHGMFAAVTYASLSGTAVPRDFVEFPSQFNERWSTYPTVFENYAKDYRTGAPMPEELAAKLKAAAKFNEGYRKTEVLAAAQLDMQWHTLAAGLPVQDTAEFEKAAIEKKGLAVGAVPPRYRSTYFSHVFAGGYAAGYYAYLWSEMLDDAAWEWFEENGGLTRANGDRLREMVLSRGNSEDLAGMYDRWIGKSVIGGMGQG